MNIRKYEDTSYGEVRRVPGKGYYAFYPATLPQRVVLVPDTVTRLADAEAALGRLAGIGRQPLNPHFLMHHFLLQEALASTRIEGIRASLQEVLEAEADGAEHTSDIEEVLNYVAAMEEGLDQIPTLPFSLRWCAKCMPSS